MSVDFPVSTLPARDETQAVSLRSLPQEDTPRTSASRKRVSTVIKKYPSTFFLPPSRRT